MKRTGVTDQLFAVPSALCRKEGDHYVGSEILLDGENEIGQCTDDPKFFMPKVFLGLSNRGNAEV